MIEFITKEIALEDMKQNKLEQDFDKKNDFVSVFLIYDKTNKFSLTGIYFYQCDCE